MARDNFRWGNGVNTSTGYDPNAANGNTNSWGDADWAAYDKRYGAPAAPSQGTEAGGGVQAAPITNPNQVQNTTANVGGTTAQGAPTTVAQSFQQQLVNRLNPAAVSASDPSIAPSIQANNLAEQRGMERNRSLLAERAAANGQDMSGGFETGLLGLAQDRAQREGQFAGNAVQHASDIQNQNINSSLGYVGNLLTGNANRDQASELANMANATQLHGIDTQGNLGAQDIALRGELGRNANNLSLLGLLQGGSQFDRSLAQNGAQFGSSLDQNGLLSLLGLL